MITRTIGIAGLVAALALPGLAAAEMAAPAGPIVLTVTGDLGESNSANGAEFDLDMLEALPQRTTETETPWYDEKTSFTGPLLSDLLDAVGVEGETLRVVALNDFAAEIPVSDIEDYPVILATRRNGERMSVRDKGPTFVVYPFDEAPELYNEMIFNRSVWQVAKIEVQ